MKTISVFISVLLLFLFSFSFPVLADCQIEQSWNYSVDSNSCRRIWSPSGQFKTLDDCKKSRARGIRFWWGVESSGKLISFDTIKYNQWVNANAGEGVPHSSIVTLRGMFSFSAITNYVTNTQRSISVPTFERVNALQSQYPVSCFGSSSCRIHVYDNKKVNDGVTTYDEISLRWRTRKTSNLDAESEDFYDESDLEYCTGEKRFFKSSSGRWSVPSSWGLQCNPVNPADYLIEKEYLDCLGGECPTIDWNLPRPECPPKAGGGGGGDDDDDDDDECDLDNLDCIKDAFNSVFPFDIFSVSGDSELICPRLVFFGYEWDLCFAYEILRYLKYPILVALGIKIWQVL